MKSSLTDQTSADLDERLKLEEALSKLEVVRCKLISTPICVTNVVFAYSSQSDSLMNELQDIKNELVSIIAELGNITEEYLLLENDSDSKDMAQLELIGNNVNTT